MSDRRQDDGAVDPDRLFEKIGDFVAGLNAGAQDNDRAQDDGAVDPKTVYAAFAALADMAGSLRAQGAMTFRENIQAVAPRMAAELAVLKRQAEAVGQREDAADLAAIAESLTSLASRAGMVMYAVTPAAADGMTVDELVSVLETFNGAVLQDRAERGVTAAMSPAVAAEIGRAHEGRIRLSPLP